MRHPVEAVDPGTQREVGCAQTRQEGSQPPIKPLFLALVEHPQTDLMRSTIAPINVTGSIGLERCR
jgi:hypothetical protein